MQSNSVPQFVTADTNIGEAVMRYPVTAEVMLSYGLSCAGCHVNQFESIRQGAMGHGGMDEEEVADLVQEMNEAIAEREGARESSAGLFVTKRAHDKIAEFAADEEDREGIFLRVKVIPGGCSGFKYDLDWDREAREDDTIIEGGKHPVRVDKDSVEFLAGAVLDYIDGLHGSGFKIDNPNAAEKCGCGSSFS
jgi:iron-sulfur cluster assembly protein